MPKPTKQVSNLINSSLNMGTNKFRTFWSYRIDKYLPYFFLSSLSQIPLTNFFYHWFTASLYQSSSLEARKEPALSYAPLPPEWRYLHICKTIHPKEWQLPSTTTCFPVGSMTAPHFLGNCKDQEQENKWCPRFGGELQVVPKYWYGTC